MEENDFQYGIKYKVVKMDTNKYLLFPVSLEKGIETEEGFKTEEELIPNSFEIDDNTNYVIDNVYPLDDLEFVYDYDEDSDFLVEVFYDDLKETIIYIDSSNLERFEVNLGILSTLNKDITFVMDSNLPSIILNENYVNELLNASSKKEIKLLLEKYKLLINKFKDINKTKRVTKISISNGQVNSIETVGELDKKTLTDYNIKYGKEVFKKEEEREISYHGLNRYLKERIYGHDEEIDTLSQILYMNYTAEVGEPVESILLVGPTGTGKTETIKAASEYLNIPSVFVNASNIVPQGIKGMSIEDVIVNLYERAGQDEEKAARGIVFLDEFDKLNDSDVDIKAAVKNILLTFTAGGTFPVDTDRYSFTYDSSMTNKIYAGVFDRILQKEKGIGFNSIISKNTILGTEEEIRKKIIDKGYFSQEELTRISTVLAFNDLDRETKKKILLSSKLSEFKKKKERYKRQFGIELVADESYIDEIINSLEESSTGMRSVNNYVKRTINPAERAILDNEDKHYKKLVLSKDTVINPYNFELK